MTSRNVIFLMFLIVVGLPFAVCAGTCMGLSAAGHLLHGDDNVSTHSAP